MEPRKIIRTDIAASAIAHLTLVGLIILISEVHPFHAAPPETVTVDIVTPEQMKQEEAKAQEKAEEKAKDEVKQEAKEKLPEPDLKLPQLDFTDKDKAAPKPAAKQQAAAPSPSPQPSPEPQRPAQQQQPQPSPKPREANAQPQQPPQAMPQPQQQAAPPPAYQAPEPDVTIKYGVMLGLPPELPSEPRNAPKDDGGDANDSTATKLPAEVIAALRRHLRSCAKLPAGVDPTDNVRIKLRTVFATDGTLAREPILIEAPPSAKGVAMMKSAMSALQSCQPYKMLPADKYEEWKVLDLPFGPRDFGG
ncbi:hypothetical protein [Bradyrhizobium cajani]|uniref:Cell envelope biogenesis protein TolA n=1 Tax=Bradyrhizobium cajani TaxID=1928661 RepID=A0A844T2N0_9BRAD|nr:hypothetical protein [Bradyrhizobium cajani]MCP3373638.1 hypothetical protein [Bradyrhizobium cajani]MVT73388.1 hypothetical protein [Bradyrhizobium cajani]